MRMQNAWLVCMLGLVGLQIAIAQKKSHDRTKSAIPDHNAGQSTGRAENMEKTIYDYELPGTDGKGVPLASYKGKVILVVNLARNSSYNDQLPALIKLSETYQNKGLVVIGIPSNDFGAAEPGTDAEIQKVYKTDDKVPFPVMARSLLIGDEAIPVYGYLTKGKGVPAGGNVHWNYTKFLIDQSGKVIARMEPDVAPDSPEMLSTLDQIFSSASRSKPKEELTRTPPGNSKI